MNLASILLGLVAVVPPPPPLCPDPLPPANALHTIWGTSATDVWAAGDSGTIVHSVDGRTWQPVASGPRASLVSLWGQAGSILAAGGDTLDRSVDQGKTWMPSQIAPDAKVLGAWGSGTV